jgi:prepilin signal peptidase PulO-like enzyme (type II secretory pathway)
MSHLIFRKSLYLFYSTRYKYYNYIVQCHYTNMKYPFCILLIVALIYILFLYIKLLIMQHLVEQCIEIYYRLTCLYTCRTYLLTLEYILLQHSNLNRKTCQNPKRQNDIHNQPRSQALYFRFPPILVPRASRPHASSLGPGTHRTGTARKLALISNAHGN